MNCEVPGCEKKVVGVVFLDRYERWLLVFPIARTKLTWELCSEHYGLAKEAFLELLRSDSR